MRTGSVVLAAMFSTALSISSAFSHEMALELKIESIDGALAQIEAVARSLKIEFDSDDLVDGLVEGLHSPDLAGIDRTQPCSVFFLIPGLEPGAAPETMFESEPQFVIAASVTGTGTAYITALKKKLGPGAEVAGVHHFPANDELYEDLYIGLSGGTAFVGNDLAAVNKVIKEAGKRPDARIKAVPGVMLLGIDVQKCVPMVQAAASQMLEHMPEGDMGGMSVPGMAVNTRQVLKTEIEALLALMKQTESLTLGFSASSAKIQLSSRVAPLAGSEFSKVMLNLKTPSERYMTIMPENALFAVVGNGSGVWNALAGPYGDFIGKLYAGMGPEMEKTGNVLKETIGKIRDLYRGDFAVGLAPSADGKELAILQVTAVTDPARANEMMEEGIKSANGIYSAMMPGVSIVRGPVRTYNGANIQAYAYKHDPASGSAGHAGGNPGMTAAMGILGRMKWETAVIGNDMICALGSSAVMNMAIDRMKKGGRNLTQSESFTCLFPEMRYKPTQVFALPLMKCVKGILRVCPLVPHQQIAQLPDSPGGIAGYSLQKGDNRISITRISVKELETLKNSADTIKTLGGQAVMGMLMGGGMSGAFMQGQGDARQNACINNLRMIQAAKEQVALEKNLQNGAVVSPEQIKEYLPGGVMPACPDGGTYTINPIGAAPTCSVPGHALK